MEGVATGANNESETLRFLVDSGAVYTLLPEKTWKRLGLAPMRSMEFVLADGSVVSRGISECRLSVAGEGGHTPVVLGEPGDDMPLLGVVTLEERALVFDPFRRELRAMTARL
ncbi:MAG: retroviral-like aspartic protease family protein [Planctomycetota bacterium]